MEAGKRINSKPVTDKINVVTVEGEIDIFNALGFKNFIVELIENGYIYIILNLDEVKYIDSTGLFRLIELKKLLADKEGKLHLVCDRARILKLFYLTGLEDLFVIHRTEDIAINDSVKSL